MKHTTPSEGIYDDIKLFVKEVKNLSNPIPSEGMDWRERLKHFCNKELDTILVHPKEIEDLIQSLLIEERNRVLETITTAFPKKEKELFISHWKNKLSIKGRE
jgi:23S rRNA maturation-related 3'-5' exoribonuclease YhaM